MNKLYWLRLPSGGATPPTHWSYSSLSLWRACPRRWWLTHSRYDNAPGGSYPPVFGVAALEGRVVHKALEAQGDHLKRGRTAPFNARQFMKKYLREILQGEMAGNPRLDAGQLEARFSLDSCAKKFFALVAGLTPTGRGGGTSGRPSPSGPPEEDSELWLTIENPPLAGKIDRVTRGGLIDFKTGEPDPAGHAEQLRTYAVLWWRRFGVRPTSLAIRYAEQQVEIEVPSEAELERQAQNLRDEMASASDLLAHPPPPARPHPEICQHCPVRQLCDAYWTSPLTLPLRTLPMVDEPGPLFRDVRLGRLPEHWDLGQPVQGTCEADGIGPVAVSLGHRPVPGTGAPFPRSARLLQVLVARADTGWLLKPTAATEVFWEEPGGPNPK